MTNMTYIVAVALQCGDQIDLIKVEAEYENEALMKGFNQWNEEGEIYKYNEWIKEPINKLMDDIYNNYDCLTNVILI